MIRLSVLIVCVVLTIQLAAYAPSKAQTASGTSDNALIGLSDGQATVPPLTAVEAADLQKQIAEYWNSSAFAGDPLAVKEKPQIRVHLGPNGIVTAIEVLNDQPNNPHFRPLRDSAIRAIRLASPLKVPARFASILLNFDPSEFQ